MDPFPRLARWWAEELATSAELTADDPEIQRVVAGIAPGSELTDLGGWMSRNLRLEPAGLVLRVHEAYVSRARLLAVQRVRRCLAEQGVRVPVPLPRAGSTAFRCGGRWAELEGYVPHEVPKGTPASHTWMFDAMGRLHRRLARLDVPVPRPLVTAFAPPATLWRWLPYTEAAVRGDSEATEITRLLRHTVGRLRRRWTPVTRLPTQLVHGDVKLPNVCRTLDGNTLYLDFGVLARRPRIHDLAFSLTHTVLCHDGEYVARPDTFAWHRVPPLIDTYEAASGSPLTAEERRALVPYAATVPLFWAASSWSSDEPVRGLQLNSKLIELGRWLLAHPDAVLG